MTCVSFLKDSIYLTIMMPKSERKRRRIILYIGIFFIFLMVTSILAGFTGISQDKLQDYNGFSFRSTTQGVVAKINGENKFFFYHPSSLSYLNFSSEVAESLSKPQIYITFDPKDQYISSIELLRFDLEEYYSQNNIVINSGVTENSSVYPLPILTCANATQYVSVMYIHASNITSISMENNCIIMQVQNELDVLAIHDKILYTLYGVME